MELGDWATWAGAAGSVAAAVVPLVLFLRERRDRIEADRRRDIAESERHETIQRLQERELSRLEEAAQREETARREEQARCISLWFENRSENPIPLRVNPGVIKISNTSNKLVQFMDVTMEMIFRESDGGVEPGREWEVYGTFSCEQVPPSVFSFVEVPVTRLTVTRNQTEGGALPPLSAALADVYFHEMTFRDAAGQYWKRDHSDRLSPF